MSDGSSLADLLLKIGVDAGEMISGFNSSSRQARQMAKDMAEGINAAFQKAFDPAAVNSGRMFENLETQYRATVSTMLRESIEARAVIERSAENVKRFALEAAEADQKIMGELLTEQANFYNVKQSLRTAELANIRATANQELEIQQRSLDMQAALRKRYAAEIAAFEKETAADRQQRMINEANQRDVLQFHSRRLASQQNIANYVDSKIDMEERATALREAILARYAAKAQEELAAEKRAREMIVEQQERSNEALKFSNKLRREAVVFMKQLEEAGIDPESDKYKAMTEEFRRQQQMQRDEFKNRDDILRQKEDEARLDRDAVSLRTAIMTAQQAHNLRVERYVELLKKGRISQTEFNAAVRRSKEIMQSQDVGSGGISGVIAQLSFGLEDFAQGIAMGDFRAAMLGASNNITMVVRGLKDMDAEARNAAFSAMKIPLAFTGIAAAGIAIVSVIHHIRNMNTELKSLTERIASATGQYFRFRQADEMATRQSRRDEELKNITEVEDIEKRRRQAELDHEDMIRRQETDRNENNVKAREAILKMLGGEANMIELQQYLLNQNTEQSKIALQQLARAQQAAISGNADVAFQEMKSLFEYLELQANAQAAQNFADILTQVGAAPIAFFDLPALNELQKYFKQGTIFNAFYGDSEEALNEIRTVLNEIAQDESKSAAERKDAAQALADIDKRAAEIAAEKLKQEQAITEELRRQAEEAGRIAQFRMEEDRDRRAEELAMITATDSEKEILRLRKEQREFSGEIEGGLGAIMGGPNAGFLGMAGGIAMLGQAAEVQANNMAFLEAQKQATEMEIAAMMQQAIPKPQGALEENAFQAQADAFKQMTENMIEKPNPQLTQVVNRLRAIEDAIKNGGTFVQVGP